MYYVGDVKLMAKKFKPIPNSLEDITLRGYKAITSIPVHCKLCGREILWICSPSGKEKSRAEYEQEMTFQVHTECLNAYTRK